MKILVHGYTLISGKTASNEGEYYSSQEQDRQCTCNITLRHIHETTVAVESNEYYIILCMCVTESMQVCVRPCVGVGARVQTCACVCVGLLIQCAMRRRHIFCALSCCIIFLILSHKWHNPCGICDGQNAVGQVFLLMVRSFPVSVILPIFCTLSFSYH